MEDSALKPRLIPGFGTTAPAPWPHTAGATEPPLWSALFASDRPIRRIHIVGGPGSGKTTLAHRLAQTLGAPVYELDRIAFEGPRYTWRSLAHRQADLRAIVAQTTWVTEGMWLGWTDDLLRLADVIIWLDDVPWRVALSRILRRFVQAGWQEARRQSGLGKVARFDDYWRQLRLLAGLGYVSWRYYVGPAGVPLGVEDIALVTRAATAHHLAAFGDKLVHCCRPSDLETVVNRLTKRET
jgi:hypothetical protein